MFRKMAYPNSRHLLWTAGFIVTVLILAMGEIRSSRAAKEFQAAAGAVTNTRDALEAMSQISAGLSEVESSARSFAISGKQSHLNPFYTAAQAVPLDVKKLELLFQDDPVQLEALTKTEPTIDRHLRVMKDMVELGNRKLFRGAAQKDLTNEGNGLMVKIRAALAEMEKHERMQLEQEQAVLAEKAELLTPNRLAGSILAGAIILGCGIGALIAARGQRKAEEKLDRLLGSMPDALVIVNLDGKIVGSNTRAEKLFGYSNRELHGESMALLVPERFRQTQRQHYAGYFSRRNGETPATTLELLGLHKDGREFPVEINTEPLVTENGLVVTSAIRNISERKRVEQQVSELNRELADRATELEAANKELESFSYSVSHDLRSPLQNIDSFSQILMEDYANRLDADGRDYVQRLRGSCQHMQDIIDALLALSSMMRSELSVVEFDLSALARTVSSDLQQKGPDRLVDWAISDGLTVDGDPQLLRVALENLLGNAWKFTANRQRARIEFGALPQSDGARTYFVRDNGAGFDMARATGLFKPFKRFHDQSQFRGTGIGLATVQRVVHRHRGRIWAEGIIDQGATFCFTLSDGNGETQGETS